MPNVEYLPLEKAMNDCNLLDFDSTAFQYWQVPKHATHKPADIDGVIVLIPVTYKSGDYGSGSYFIQVFYGRNAHIYTRTLSYVSGKQTFGEWNDIGVNQQLDLTNFISTPESQTPVTDANNINKSGMYRTQESGGDAGAVKTANLPDNVSAWGVLLHFFENNKSSSKAGFQLYSPTGEQGKGKLYFRSYAGNSPNKDDWKAIDVTQIAQMQDQVFTHPTKTLQSVDANTPTGFYLTTVNTQGLDGIPQDKKDGVLKVTKDGDISLQRYQPSLAGSTDVYIRTLTSISTRATSTTVWQKLGESTNHLNVIDSRSEDVDNPLRYFENSNRQGSKLGYLVYEWKYTGDFDGTGSLPTVEKNKRCILKTVVPYDKNTVTNKDESDIWQTVYVNDGTEFIRHGSPTGNSWGRWKSFSSGSGQTQDLQTWLTQEFKKWRIQGSVQNPDEQAFLEWVYETNKLKYKGWARPDLNGAEKEEREAFKEYVLSIVPASTGGINFKSWTTFDDN